MNKKLYFLGILALTILIFAGLVAAGFNGIKNGDKWFKTYDGKTHYFTVTGQDLDGDGYIDINENGESIVTLNTQNGENPEKTHPAEKILLNAGVCTTAVNSNANVAFKICLNRNKYVVGKVKTPGVPWKNAPHSGGPKGDVTQTAPIPGPGPGPYGPAPTIP